MRVSSRHTRDRFITKYEFPEGEIDSIDRAQEVVQALLASHEDLFPLFPEAALRNQIATHRFIVINGEAVSFTSENYDIEARYQDYFSEGLLNHPTSCPHRHHFELVSAQLWAQKKGPLCPVSSDHSVGTLEEDSSLAREIHKPTWRFIASMKFFLVRRFVLSSFSSLTARINKIWQQLKSWLSRPISQTCLRLGRACGAVWQKAQHLARRISQPAEEPNPFLDDSLYPEDPTNIDDAYRFLNIDRSIEEEAVIARRDFLVSSTRRITSRASPLLKQGFDRCIRDINIACETILASKR